jgi:hypothetical protein
MSSDEADALVISNDPLHVRLLREMPANTEITSVLARESHSRAVRWVLSAWVGYWDWRGDLYPRWVGLLRLGV